MRISFTLRTIIILLLCASTGPSASAHPGSGIVVDKHGQVFFTDTGRGVWKIDTLGRLTYVPASRWHWMAIDETGSFESSEKSFAGWFERVTPPRTKPVLIMSSDFPLTIGRDGNLYYADTRRSSPGIVRRKPDGTETRIARGEKYLGVSGIAAGPDGSLYITDAGRPDSNALCKISPDGTVSTIAGVLVGKGVARDIPPATDPGYCRGLAVDSGGYVIVAATGSRRVLKVSPRGAVSTVLETESPWSPTGVALYRGEIYVLEWRDSPPDQTEVRQAWVPRVRKIGRDGKVATLATVSR
jgi:DNA-binding beta-propeller fold protein YncE